MLCASWRMRTAMPRIHINLHDIDEIEDLEDWEKLIGLGAEGRRDSRPVVVDQRGSRGGFREVRFGGGEAVDRKRAERRKHSARSVRRPS
jgi:hypothetical protein